MNTDTPFSADTNFGRAFTFLKKAQVPHCLSIAVLFGLLALLLSVPLSYWFQPGTLRMVVSLPEYVRDILAVQSKPRDQDVFGVLSVVKSTMLSLTLSAVVLGHIIGGILDTRRGVSGLKIFFSILGAWAVFIVVPVAAGWANGDDAGAEYPSSYWNNQNFVGTTWVVKTEVGEMTASFMADGTVQLRHPLIQQFANIPYVDGTWSITGDKLNFHATVPAPLSKSIDYTATIEAKAIYGTGPERLEARQVR